MMKTNKNIWLFSTQTKLLKEGDWEEKMKMIKIRERVKQLIQIWQESICFTTFLFSDWF